jgi:hypothetical protein
MWSSFPFNGMAAEKFSNAQYALNQTVLAVFTRRKF